MTVLDSDRDASSEHQRGPGLEVSWAFDGLHFVVALSGEIDAANAEALPALVAAAPGSGSSIRVDIGDVTFLDSSLLRALLICQASVAAAGGDFKVRNAPEQAHQLFELTSLTSLLEEH